MWHKQLDPDVTAKTLFIRLQREHSGCFPDGQLRTLQRRVREWRQVMARKLSIGMRQIHKAGEKLFVDYAGQTNREETSSKSQKIVMTEDRLLSQLNYL